MSIFRINKADIERWAHTGRYVSGYNSYVCHSSGNYFLGTVKSERKIRVGYGTSYRVTSFVPAY